MMPPHMVSLAETAAADMHFHPFAALVHSMSDNMFAGGCCSAGSFIGTELIATGYCKATLHACTSMSKAMLTGTGCFLGSGNTACQYRMGR